MSDERIDEFTSEQARSAEILRGAQASLEAHEEAVMEAPAGTLLCRTTKGLLEARSRRDEALRKAEQAFAPLLP